MTFFTKKSVFPGGKVILAYQTKATKEKSKKLCRFIIQYHAIKTFPPKNLFFPLKWLRSRSLLHSPVGWTPLCVFKCDFSWTYQSRIFINKDVLHLIEASVYPVSSFPLHQRLSNLQIQTNPQDSLEQRQHDVYEFIEVAKGRVLHW